MRFSDSPVVEVSATIDAPVAAVWPLVSDLDLLARHSEEFQGGEWLDGAKGPGPGARFRGRNQNARAAWEVTCTVIEWDPEHSFAWCVEDPANPVATWRFSMEPDGSGTSLTYTARMGPGPSGVTAIIERHPDQEEQIIEARMANWATNMQATVDGVRSAAEA